MTGWLQLTDEQRKTSINQAAVRSSIEAKALEKDWWVTLVLKALFTSTLAQHFIFKGGTSLSKGWKLLQRFSEDIDIALDPAAFGRPYQTNPSHTFVKTIKKEGCAFTSTTILTALQYQLGLLGIPPGMVSVIAAPVPANLPDRDPQTIYVRYPSLYPPTFYLADEVKIEFSVRSLKEPYASVPILSLLSEYFPNAAYAETPFDVTAVEPHKTLLEKMFLLHEKFLTNPHTLPVGERPSRHLYDLYKLIGTPAETKALNDHRFYQTLLEHRRKYVRLAGVDYTSLQPITLSFVPPRSLLAAFREDYQQMLSAMLYENKPSFDNIMQQIHLLNGKVKMMGEGRSLEEVIEKAKLQLIGNYNNGSTMAPYVEYKADEYMPASPGNETIIYQVNFNRADGEWIFDSISFK